MIHCFDLSDGSLSKEIRNHAPKLISNYICSADNGSCYIIHGHFHCMLKLHHPYTAIHAEKYLREVLSSGDFASGGHFTTCASEFLKKKLDCQELYLTHSCTDALEMAALLSSLQPGEEVLIPSFTFVSTANAFELRGASIRFADCMEALPNVSIETLLPQVTSRTRVIVVMHYAGIAVDMDPIIEFCKTRNILLIEDAAHAFASEYKGIPLGCLSDLSAFSFHATKVLTCGEGGCLLVRNPNWVERADSLYEKGTNRKLFQKKNLKRYEWVSPGSSFGMSEFQAAVLWSQLEEIDAILSHRVRLWEEYNKVFSTLHSREFYDLPQVPPFAKINGSHYFITLHEGSRREELIAFLKVHSIETAFHYLSLHRSPYYANKHHQNLKNTDRFEQCLLRFPIHNAVSLDDVARIADLLERFFKK